MTIKLIKELEGCHLNSYLCPAGIPTIGYGNTYYKDGSKVKLGDKITQQEADELLIYILSKLETEIKPLIKVKLTDNKISALISFVYNVGLNAFKNSTLLKKINENAPLDVIQKEWYRWNKIGSKISKGLEIRRRAEYKLYSM